VQERTEQFLGLMRRVGDAARPPDARRLRKGQSSAQRRPKPYEIANPRPKRPHALPKKRLLAKAPPCSRLAMWPLTSLLMRMGFLPVDA
jgi:hypothetical protein